MVGWAWPSLEEELRLHLPEAILDVGSRDDKTYYCSTTSRENSTRIIEVEPGASSATWEASTFVTPCSSMTGYHS